jgi:hypothetical protein
VYNVINLHETTYQQQVRKFFSRGLQQFVKIQIFVYSLLGGGDDFFPTARTEGMYRTTQ